MMKKRILLFCLVFLLNGFVVIAQSTYQFSTNPSGTYVPLTGGTQVFTQGVDNNISSNLPIGFSFKFGGCNPTIYSNFQISSNGFISLGGTLGGAFPGNNLNLTGSGPIIAPLWDDLLVGTGGTVSYLTSGTSGSKILTIEWNKMNWGVGANGPVMSFQVKLYESDNHIEFCYYQEANPAQAASASIGITSGNNNDFYSVSDAITNPFLDRNIEHPSIYLKANSNQVYSFLPSTFSLSSSVVPVSCNGGANGELTAYVSGGIGPFSFAWNTGDNVSHITNKSVGNYTVTVTDNHGCQKSATYSITQPTLPLSVTANTSGSISTCAGGSKVFNSSVSGGTGPYTYNWTPAAGLNSATVGNPTAIPSSTTVYTLTVADNNGCVASDQVTISVNNLPTSIAGTDASICPSQQITLGTSTTAGYTYSWSPGSGLSSSSVSNPVLSLATPGTYSYSVVTTEVASGCSSSDLVVITVLVPPSTANAGIDQNVCNSSTITLAANSPTVGTGTWILVSGSGSITNVNNASTTITGIPAGTSVDLKWSISNNGCNSIDNVVVTNYAPATAANAGADMNVCVGAAANLSGNSPVTGIGTWSLITGSATVDNPASNTSSVSGLTNGSVSVFRWTITNGACSSNDDVQLTVQGLPSVTATANLYGICNGGSSTLTSTATGGGGGYTYNWSPATALSSTNTISVSANPSTTTIYTSIVTDSYGCANGDTVEIIVKPTPFVNSISSQTICEFQNTTAVSFSGSPGAAFDWTNANTAIGLGNSASGNIASFMAANPGNVPLTSTVTVTPKLNGCAGSSKTFDFVVNPSPDVTAGTANQTFCAGNVVPVTTFTSNVTGATFNWTNTNTAIGLAASGSGNLPGFTALNAGSTDVTATVTVAAAANGCVGANNNFNFVIHALPAISGVTATNATLCGANDGQIQITATGLATLKYSIDNASTYLVSNNFTSLAPGNYPVWVKDGNACSVNWGTATIIDGSAPSAPVASSLVNFDLCPGAASPVFSVNNAGFNYTWYSDAGLNTVVGTGVTFSPALPSPGNSHNYYVTANGVSCSSNATQFTVKTNLVLNGGVIDGDRTICSGNAPGILNNITSASGGDITTGYNYTWEYSYDASSWLSVGPSADTLDAPTLTQTTYFRRKVTNNCGFAYSNIITITVNAIPSVNTPSNAFTCPGDNFTTVTFSGSVTGVTYSWTADANYAVIGLANQTGTGDINSFVAGANTTGNMISTTLSVYAINGTCAGPSTGFSFVVYPTPSVNTMSNQESCSGAVISVPDFVTVPSGANTNWSANNLSVGLPFSGTGNLNSWTGPVNTNTAPLVTTVNVTPTANGCFGSSMSFDIVVNPLPTAVAISNLALCPGNTVSLGSFGVAPSGSIVNWNNNNIAIGLASSGNADIPDWNLPLNKTGADITGTITYQPSYNGCLGASQSFDVTLKSGPALVVNGASTICEGESTTLTATGAITYLWDNSAMSPTLVVSPLTTTNYTVQGTNPNGCSLSVVNTVVVNPKPVVSASVMQPTCLNNNGVITSTSTISLGTITYSWSTGSVASSISGLTPGTYQLTIESDGGCKDSATYVINTLASTNVVQGNVKINSLPAQNGLVKVYEKTHSGAYILLAEQFTDVNGNYSFSALPSDTVVIGVFGNVNGNSYSVYYGDTEDWTLAASIDLDCSSSFVADINLTVPLLPDTGNGTNNISGRVLDVTTWGPRRPGEPLRGVDITVDGNPGGAVYRTQTNANGDYNFANIPSGNYKLSVDVPGCGVVRTYDFSFNNTVTYNEEKNFFVDSLGGTIDTATSVDYQACTFIINATATPACLGSANELTDLTLYADTSLLGYQWDFTNDGVIDDTTKGTVNHLYPAKGVYTAKLRIFAYNGLCENTVLVNVVVDSSSYRVVNQNACVGDSVYTGGAYQYQSGIFTDSLLTSSGCDSIITTYLRINQLPRVTLDLSRDTVCNQGGLMVALSESPYGGVFSGTPANSGVFDPTGLNGVFDFIYTYTDSNGCIGVDTAFLFVDICSGVSTVVNKTPVLSPNPAHSVVVIEGLQTDNKYLVEVKDISGKILYNSNMVAIQSKIELPLSMLTNGVYFLTLKGQEVVHEYRFIKN